METKDEVLLSDVIARLEKIVADVKAELSDGARLIGARVELTEVKNLLDNWLMARAARLNIAAETKRGCNG